MNHFARKPRHADASMTRAQNKAAAFTAVTMGQLDKINAAFIARCHGLSVVDVQTMIDERKAREAAHG